MLLGIDIGTSGTKATLLTNEGKFISDAYKPYDTIAVKPYHVEQDSNVWWDALKEVIPRCLKQASLGHEVNAMCLSSQAGTMVPVDENCIPLTNAITWQDSRCENERLKLLEDYDDDFFYKRTGWKLNNCYNMIQIFWMKQNIPEVYDKTYMFLGTSDYLNYKLIGEYVVDFSDAGQRQLINVSRKEWDKDILNIIGIEKNKLSRLVKTGEPIGTLKKDVAAELGLNEGVVLVSGSQDQYCAAVGINAVHKNDTMLSTGTGWDMIGFTDKIIYDTNSYMSFTNHVVEGLYTAYAYTPVGSSALKWYRLNMGEKHIDKDGNIRLESYSEMDARAQKIPAGSDGLLFSPHFVGTLYPTWSTKSKSVLSGLGFFHNRDHIARAAMEGVVFEIAWMVEGMKAAGYEINAIKTHGGATNSNFWMQILADVTGLPVIIPLGIEVASTGAAMIAGYGIGLFNSYDEAYKIFGIKESRIDVNPEKHKQYRPFFEKYKSTFHAMKAVFDQQ